MYFEIYRDKKAQYRWRLVAEKGKTVATSGGDGYVREQDCRDGIALVQNTTADTPIKEGVSKGHVSRPPGVETKP